MSSTDKGFTEKAKDVAHDVVEKTGDLVDKVGEKIPDSVKDTAGDLKEKAEDLVDKLKDKLGFGDDDTQETDAPVARTADVPPPPDPNIPTANPT